MARLPRVEDKRAKNECDKRAKDAECRYKRMRVDTRMGEPDGIRSLA
jgi:hypothetical protein